MELRIFMKVEILGKSALFVSHKNQQLWLNHVIMSVSAYNAQKLCRISPTVALSAVRKSYHSLHLLKITDKLI